MPNSQNLKPFKKGQSGNPKGRPTSRPLNNAIREAINAESMDKCILKEIALKILSEAKKGNMAAIKILFERLDGPPPKTAILDLPNNAKEEKHSELLKLIRAAVFNGEIDINLANELTQFLTSNRAASENESIREIFPAFTNLVEN